MTFLNILFMIISVFIIILCLLQQGKSNDLSAIKGRGSGFSDRAFVENKERGPEVIISRITMVLGILFFTLAIIIHFLLVR